MTSLFVPATSVALKPVDWLWRGRIPCGSLTIVEGKPGDCKSTVMSDIAARISTGRDMPGAEASISAGGVLWIGDEDLMTTTRRNLTLAGANLNSITIYDKLAAGQLILPDAAALIEAEIMRLQAALVVIDPISAFISGSANAESVVRKAIGPLTAIADRTNAAIVLVRHLRKGGGGPALYHGAGSIGLIAAARSGLLIGRDPNNADRRIIAPFKSNGGELSESLAFGIVDEPPGVRVEWLGTSECSANQLVANPAAEELSALDEACEVLFTILGEGPVLANEALHVASQAGISTTTIKRAKRRMNVESKRKGFGPKSEFYWSLPTEGELVNRLKDEGMDELSEPLISGEQDLPADALDS